jgi:hypothetical protein
MTYSSLAVKVFEPDGPNMIDIRHFTGALLLSRDEARQLRQYLELIETTDSVLQDLVTGWEITESSCRIPS